MKCLKLTAEKAQLTLWYIDWMIVFVITGLPILLPFILGGEDLKLPMGILLGVQLLIMIPIYFWIAPYYKTLKYEIDVDEVRFAKGVFWRKRVSVPFPKITNIDISQGPLERKFKVGRVKVQTAGFGGGSSPELLILGLSNYVEIKEMIMERVSRNEKSISEYSEPLSESISNEAVMQKLLEEVTEIRKMLAQKS
jgi:uncharacterized protein